MTETPRLDRPGAGLPFLERLLARHWVLPLYWKTTSWDQAQRRFEKEGAKILALTKDLSPEKLAKPVLIDRIRGIEDSSRFWSPAMTMEHLIIVGDLMARATVDLSQDRDPVGEADVAKVKPSAAFAPAQARDAFATFLERFGQRMTEVGDRGSKRVFRHPWFGELTAHQWHGLAAFHQALHRKQIQLILAGSA